ncbi:MAG TPA: nuclear transport factor 2 family protein [Steroidobacteraceae bacterium]|nr:nuclear transport factor 2 family protein [Steroidobacteraceae bacterium]
MDNEQRLAQLERKIQYLTDRTAILDCIARNARGCDRHDRELLASSYHDDGTDEHGYEVNPGARYPDYANKVHAAGSMHNMHNITTHTCEIDGDTAHCESYVIGLFLNTDGKSARLIAGRYVDRLERREGEWKIALRRSTVEVLMTGDASILSLPLFTKLGYLRGTRDERDVSYQRPLTLEETPDRWDVG